VKLFVSEPGSQEMIDLFTRSEDRALLVSVLAAVEVRSAIRRRHLAGDIDTSDADLAISTLIQETGRIIEHPISGSVIAEATGLVDRYGLRALDSIQLASAMVARATLDRNDSMTFAASDHKLLQAAQKEGFSVWNPASIRP
jgi:uncharacterized protein